MNSGEPAVRSFLGTPGIIGGVPAFCVPIEVADHKLATPASLDAWLTSPEKERLSRFSLPKRRSEWVAGRFALKTLILSEAQKLGLTIPGNGFSVVSEGELPRLIPGPGLAPQARDFLKNRYASISHGGGLAAAVFCEHPAGIDVEGLRPLGEGLLNKFLVDSEKRLIAPEEFIVLWTVKEAVCKAHGQGFGVGDLLKILLTEFTYQQPFQAAIPSAGARYHCFSFKENGWFVSIARGRQQATTGASPD